MGLFGSIVSGAVRALSGGGSNSTSSSGGSSGRVSNNSGSKTIADYQRDYADARLRGDASGMNAANRGANAIRAQNGESAVYAGADIANTKRAYDAGQYSPQQAYSQYSEFPSYQPPDDYMDIQREQDRLAREREEQARRLYESQVQQGTDRLNAQRDNVNRTYDDASRQAYISYMQNQRTIPGQLASAGITGGAAESTLLGAQTAYQGSLGNIDTAKQKAMQDIDMAITDLRNSGDIQKAQYIMENRDKIAENFAQNAYAEISRNDNLAHQNREYAMQEREFDFRNEQLAASNAYKTQTFNASQEKAAYQRALQQATKTGDYSGMSQYGWDSGDIGAANAKAAPKGRSGGRGGGGSHSSGSKSYAPSASYGSLSYGAQTDASRVFGNDYDTNSILALNLGPIDKPTLERMIKSGELDVKMVNGKIHVFRTAKKPQVQPNLPFPKF